VNPRVNAVISPDFDGVLASIPRGVDAPRLAAMPYLIKDLRATVRTLSLANGSIRFKGTAFDFDSTTAGRFVKTLSSRRPTIGLDMPRTRAEEFMMTKLASMRAGHGLLGMPIISGHGSIITYHVA
jgi:hypothetical protein